MTIPAGSYSNFSGTFYNIDAGVTVTTATNSITATVTGNAENRVAFSADGNMVTLGRGAEDVAGAVSVGSALSLRRVTGVADAVATDDIINVGQLNAALGAPTSALPNAIEAENDRLNGVSAMTAAMSALQLNPRRQGQLSLSMGLGFYEGETAGALGLSLRASEFSHVQFSIAGSDQTSSQTAVSFNFAW